ncbi:MAG TPA: NADH:flavin oxidoreductase [Caulobacteraceae bacterium]|nr:NADH:flavin oxidoreductase [Caulobacteraceae bacterium]
MTSTDETKTAPEGRLFEPFAVGELRLRNRIVMAPMTRRRCPEGVPGDDVARYYARRAEGGVGLIITEGIYPDHPTAEALPNVPRVSTSDALAGWRGVVEGVHRAGAAIACQLWHMGPARRVGLPPDPALPGWGPMDVREDGELLVKGMTEADIETIIASYARSALAAKAAGFDAVEIHGAHGYLIDAFFWASANRRADRYGEGIAGRGRFAREVVAAVRREVGPHFPILFRFSQWKSTDYAARIADTPDELLQLLGPLVDAGVDIFHASTRRIADPAFEGSARSLAGWTRNLTGRPVIGVGSVGLNKAHESLKYRTRESLDAGVASLAPALDILARGEADLIAVGRALIADPEWPAKVREGRQAEIRPLTPADLEHLT